MKVGDVSYAGAIMTHAIICAINKTLQQQLVLFHASMDPSIELLAIKFQSPPSPIHPTTHLV